jgi:V8-like Glu-specific endopeptidase
MKSLVLALNLMWALSAFAFPLPKYGVKIQAHPKTFTTDYDFEGIVALSNCSGSLIQLENGRDTDKALVLTNGHCYEGGFPEAGTFISNRASHRSFRVMDSHANNLGSVTATTVLYSTMTKTDITLYKLAETYADIKQKFGVRPLMLSSKHPDAKMPIEVISGYWKKGYTCSIDRFVYRLKEGDWVSEDSIRYTQPGCETIGGTSGSPVVLAGTRTVIGVNNTGNDDGDQCTEDNPCEIDQQGKTLAEKGAAYGQQTYWIYSCLSSNNELDVKTPGCLLFH